MLSCTMPRVSLMRRTAISKNVRYVSAKRCIQIDEQEGEAGEDGDGGASACNGGCGIEDGGCITPATTP